MTHDFTEPDEDYLATEAALAENIRLGYIEVVGIDDDGEPRYRLTPAGIKHVERMIEERRA